VVKESSDSRVELKQAAAAGGQRTVVLLGLSGTYGEGLRDT